MTNYIAMNLNYGIIRKLRNCNYSHKKGISKTLDDVGSLTLEFSSFTTGLNFSTIFSHT